MVPLFGDMQISLIAYVKKCPHFEPSKWSCAAGNAEERAGLSQYNLLNRMGQIHEEHLKIISELARCSNDVSLISVSEIPPMIISIKSSASHGSHG